MLNDLLKNKKCFKLICGAGNEDIEEVKKLVYIYTLAGCRFFDISANENVLNSAKQALDLAGVKDANIAVSIGIKGDPHSNKAQIDYNKCINCGSCESVCPQNAIEYAKVKKVKCIGCGKCEKVCPKSAITYIHEEKNLQEVIPPLIKSGIDCIELHIISQDENEINSKWAYLNDKFKGMLSICISRGYIGDTNFIRIIKNLIKDRAPYTTIIQADGFPMSGGEDDYKTTLQAVAAAEIVQNANLPIYLMLSGGTNSKTSELAKLCGINYHSIAIGSFARKIIEQFTKEEDFWDNEHTISQAVKTAKNLIVSTY